MRRAIGALVIVISVPFTASAWTDPVHQRVAELATKLMPPSLASQLEKHQGPLLVGAVAPDRSAAPSTHAFHVDGSGGALDTEIAAAAAEAVRILREQEGFAALSRQLGLLSHLVADVAYPLNTSTSDAREPLYYDDFGAYTARKLDRFMPVFNGYVDMSDGFDLRAYLQTIADRANRGYPFVSSAYFPDGASSMRSSQTFDDRGPVFGTAQLSFVNAVTATANVWLWVWREAHGDLSGTPFRSATGRTPDGKNTSRAAQRPR